MTPRQLAAYHEAGHVVMALAMDFPVVSTSVEKCTECPAEDDCWIGATAYGTDEFRALPDDGPSGIARYIILCAAGVAAEDHANGAPVEGDGGLSDEVAASQAAFVLAFAAGRKLATRVMESAPERATEILTQPAVWAAVVAVAEALDHSGSLTTTGILVVTDAHRDGIEEAREALYLATIPPLLGR